MELDAGTLALVREELSNAAENGYGFEDFSDDAVAADLIAYSSYFDAGDWTPETLAPYVAAVRA